MDEQQASTAAKQFEAFFIGQMLEYMHTDVDGQGLFGGGHSEDMWRSMLNQEYDNEIAKNGPIGIADAVMRSLLAAQSEATTGQNAPPVAQAAPVAAAALAASTEKDELR